MGDISVNIKTADGVADCHVFYPPGNGPHPAILFYMDGLGIRPELLSMGERLAENGFAVLMPNLFYRAGPQPRFTMDDVATDGPVRARMMALVQALTLEAVKRDTAAFLGFFDTDNKIAKPAIGCVGYCMGGSMALTAAGTWPNRVAAAASIHGARLATDQPDSPHLLAKNMRGKIYVAVAGIDPWLVPGETQVLRAAFEAAGTNYQMEDYPTATHGFAPPGGPVYDRDASELHWERLLALFGETLR